MKNLETGGGEIERVKIIPHDAPRNIPEQEADELLRKSIMGKLENKEDNEVVFSGEEQNFILEELRKQKEASLSFSRDEVFKYHDEIFEQLKEIQENHENEYEGCQLYHALAGSQFLPGKKYKIFDFPDASATRAIFSKKPNLH